MNFDMCIHEHKYLYFYLKLCIYAFLHEYIHVYICKHKYKGVYGESNGNTVDEVFRMDTRSEKSTKMIAAEESVLSRGGSAVRLAGLYTKV